MKGTGKSRKFKKRSSQAVMPSSWGMLVCNKVTSSVIRRVPDGSVGSLLSLLIKSVVFVIYEGRVEMRGCRKQSTKCVIFL